MHRDSLIEIVVISLLAGIGWRLANELVLLLDVKKEVIGALLLVVIGGVSFGLVNGRQLHGNRYRLTEIASKTEKASSIPLLSSTPILSTPSHSFPSPSTSTHKLEDEFIKAHQEENPFTAAVAARLKAADLPTCPAVPLEQFYSAVHGKCCESVIGMVQVPVGLVGPIDIGEGKQRFLPLATVEGALVASVRRGCKALMLAGRVGCVIGGEKGMTRGPCIEAESLEQARDWLNDFTNPGNLPQWQQIFDQSSPGGHIHLKEIRGRQIGRLVYLRFRAECGEAMGMNMMSRGCEYFLTRVLPPGTRFCLSGNFCTDKKPSAVNWIEGRGLSVIAEASIPADIMASVLKVKDLPGFCRFVAQKNLIGSAAAGSLGGFNAHVANTVAAAYLATGQDIAQVVDAAAAMTLVDLEGDGSGIRASLTIPCLEVGFRGGGTCLPHQEHFLKRVSGCANREEFAQVIAVGALGGELSLLAALYNQGELVQAHTSLNK